jgi:ABC-type phosphate transport system substrate-binding protein
VTRRAAVLATFALLALAAGVASPAVPPAQGPAVAVVVGRDVALADLSLPDLRRILLGDRQFWGDRTRITVLVPPPGSPERAVVLRVIFRMRESEYRQYWIAKIFRAEVTSGPRVAGADQAKRLVDATPGAIALIPASAVDGSVKVLRVNGIGPGQAGYALR